MKRIVICCDGTWQDENADYPTNVALIAQAVTVSDGDVKQIVFYDPGVGTQGGFQFRWVIADAADKRYLMRADTENF